MSLVRVKPALRVRPSGIVETFGPEVVDLCTQVGFEPDEDQAEILDDIFAINDAGLPAAFEYCIICARQNLKTAVEQMAAMGWLFVTEQYDIVWSAHEMTTTLEAQEDIANLIQNSHLSKYLPADRSNGVIHKNGHEAIKLRTGQKIRFKARTSGGGRGLSGDKIVLDEGFAVTGGMLGSLMPTLSTRPEAQIVWGSSAGHLNSDALRRVRDRARAESDPKLGYREFSAPVGGCVSEMCSHEHGQAEGCALDNPANWQLANPAMGRRITQSYIESERRSLPPAEFARERLGWWEDPPNAEGSVIGGQQWEDLKDPKSAPQDPVSFGLYVNLERTKVAIGVAGHRPDKFTHVGIVPAVRGSDVDSLPGTGWIADRIIQLWQEWHPGPIIIARDSGAASLATDLQKRGIKVTLVDVNDVARSAERFYDLVVAEEIRHVGAAALGRSVTGAKKKELADSWTWDRKDELSDITQLMSVTLALHGLNTRRTPMIHVWND